MTRLTNSQRIRVGSWPGASYAFNPFIRMFCASLEAAGADVVDVPDPSANVPKALDIVHVHWPDMNFWLAWSRRNAAKRCVLSLWRLAWAKARGAKVVWMVHDLRPLHRDTYKAATWKLFIRSFGFLVDGFMTLSPETVAAARAAYPFLRRRPFAAPNHPTYAAATARPERSDARAALGLPQDATVFAFFGVIRPPKGVASLARAFRGLQGEHLRLILAGEPLDRDYLNEITDALAGDRRVTLRAEYLSEADAAAVAAAADVFVLPFKDTLHSGSILYALSAGRPVITPSSPYAQGVASRVGPGWLTLYEGELTAEALSDWRAPAKPADLSAFSPEQLGETSLAFYRQLLAPH